MSRVPAALARLSVAMEQLEKLAASHSLKKPAEGQTANPEVLKEFEALKTDYQRLKKLAANISTELGTTITDIDDVLLETGS